MPNRGPPRGHTEGCSPPTGAAFKPLPGLLRAPNHTKHRSTEPERAPRARPAARGAAPLPPACSFPFQPAPGVRQGEGEASPADHGNLRGLHARGGCTKQQPPPPPPPPALRRPLPTHGGRHVAAAPIGSRWPRLSGRPRLAATTGERQGARPRGSPRPLPQPCRPYTEVYPLRKRGAVLWSPPRPRKDGHCVICRTPCQEAAGRAAPARLRGTLPVPPRSDCAPPLPKSTLEVDAQVTLLSKIVTLLSKSIDPAGHIRCSGST